MGRGIPEVHLDSASDPLFSGTHKGADGASVLSDPGAEFLSCGVHSDLDLVIKNTTDGSEGTITAATEDTVTATLSGGTDNVWHKFNPVKIVNGDMELDSNWDDLSSPTTNERSTTQKHGGTYSRRFVSGGLNTGIQSDVFTTVTGMYYFYIFWVFPVDDNRIRMSIRHGDDSDWACYNTFDNLTLNAWNQCSFGYYETRGGSGIARLRLYDHWGNNGYTWYVDDVVGGEVNPDEYVILKTDEEDSVISTIYTDRRFGQKALSKDQLVDGLFPEDIDLDQNNDHVWGPGQPQKIHD